MSRVGHSVSPASSTPSRGGRLLVASLVAAGGLVLSTLVGLPALLLAATVSTGLATALVITLGELAYGTVGYAFAQTGDGAGIAPSWALPDRRGWALVAGATAAAVALNRLVFGLGVNVGIDPVGSVPPPDGLSVTGLLVVVPVLLVVVGPAEEYLFRGVIQSYLGTAFSAWGAIGWAAALFTAVHLPNVLVLQPSALVVSVPVWLAVGLLFGWLYETSGTLAVPALVHGLYDVVLFTLVFAEWGLL